MSKFTHGDVTINYEVHGEGFPLLLFAPGGMRSAASFWRGAEWDPIETLSPHFKVIAMDQRNAGESTAPVSSNDGWHTYTGDHLALLRHLGIDRLHVLGGCIGGPYCFGMMQAAPQRVCAAVLQQSIGFEDNRQLFYDMFDDWAVGLKASHTEATDADWDSFRGNMYDGDFLFNTSQDFVANCSTPLLVLMGSDPYHPETISREIANLAPNATLVEDWKEDGRETAERVIEFLRENTPTSS